MFAGLRKLIVHGRYETLANMLDPKENGCMASGDGELDFLLRERQGQRGRQRGEGQDAG